VSAIEDPTSAEGPLVLVIDDELQIRRFLRVSLETNGYRVAEAENGMSAIAEAARLRPDLIVLDFNLPDLTGLEVLKRVREWTNTPVIMLSVRDAERDKAAALDAGADDYLTKPFSTVELLARLRVASRHAQPAATDTVYAFGDVQIDLVRRVVTRRGEPVRLTPTEYALLRLMVQHAGRVLTHRQILRQVWGPEYVDETHYLRVYFAQLRQKLGEDPTHPKLIVTEPGVGYRLMVE
jgi:two-component system KDP operon response regulator KdpE